MRAFLLGPLLACLAWPAFADARMTVLVDVLKLQEAAVILRDEGLAYADELNADMLGGQGGAGWQVQVSAIYDPARLVEEVRQALEAELDSGAVEASIAFFSTPLGSRIVTLENAARRAMAAQEVEEAARGRYLDLSEAPTARLTSLMTLAQDNDMIGRNVTSAMNANFQFMRGLADGKVIESTEEEMLSDIAGDMGEITEDTTSWLYGFFLLAYDPISQAELDTYIAFSGSPDGQALNRALFVGFGKAYEDISYALGRAVALNMQAEEL